VTAAERLRQRRRFVTMASLGGFAMFFAGLIVPAMLGAPAWTWWLGVIGLAGVIVAGATGVGSYFFGFHCPACRSNLSSTYLHGTGYAQYRSVRFCPYCGTDFDAIDIEGRLIGPTQS
jgi:hypothetical protein